MDTEECVLEAVQGIQTATEVSIIDLPTDETEEKLLSQFMASGCGCTKVKGTPCFQQFSPEYVRSVRASCVELGYGATWTADSMSEHQHNRFNFSRA